MFLWIAATVIAFFVKGLCGFANTMVFTSMLSFATNNIDISPIDLMLSYFTNSAIVVRERKRVEWRIVLPLAGLMFLGLIPGLFFLKNTDAKIVKIGFGVIIVYLGLNMLWRDLHPNQTHKDSKIGIIIIGVLAGVMSGMYGIGALLSAYLTRMSKDTRSFKANICTVFLIEDTLRVVMYAVTGIITLAALKRTLMLTPFMALGLFIGIKSANVLNERTARKIVIIMLIISGAALIANNL